MSIDEFNIKMDQLSEYINLRIDIIANNPKWWLGTAKHQLPSFDYYLYNLRDIRYDISKRKYRTEKQCLPLKIHT